MGAAGCDVGYPGVGGTAKLGARHFLLEHRLPGLVWCGFAFFLL